MAEATSEFVPEGLGKSIKLWATAFGIGLAQVLFLVVSTWFLGACFGWILGTVWFILILVAGVIASFLALARYMDKNYPPRERCDSYAPSYTRKRSASFRF